VDRTEKQELVSELRKLFEDAEAIVVTHYSGLTVAQMETLRKRMRDAGAGFKVAKNRLVRLALEGTNFQGLGDLFKGPTAIAYSKDPVAPAKIAAEFAKTNDKLVILGGGMGKQVLDVEGVKALATLPSLDELRGKLVGLLVAPATKIAGVVQAPGGQLARVVKAYADKGEAA
jgi:large subunit ribosomal protein L10